MNRTHPPAPPVPALRASRSRPALPVAGAVVALGLLAAGCVAPPRAGDEGPTAYRELILPRIPDGEAVSLREAGLWPAGAADADGRVMLVDLWATWCVPCVAELPHLQELSDSLPEEDFLMVGIVLESGDAEKVAPFLTEHNLTYPNLMGSDEARDSFGPFLGYPTKYLIGRDGKLVKRYLGAVGEILNEEIAQVIATGSLD